MWIYKGSEFTSDMIKDNIAFVYIITDTTNGKKYIGKKVFHFKKTMPPLKGRKNKRHKKVDSDWQSYYGSSKVLLKEIEEKGKDKFEREIVSLHPNKTEANYHEMKLQFMLDVLEARNDAGERMFYNENINCKFYPSKNQDTIEHRKIINEEYLNDIIQ
jgi:hypothetical protein